MKKNTVFKMRVQRHLGLLLLGFALLAQSCSKESDKIAPQTVISAEGKAVDAKGEEQPGEPAAINSNLTIAQVSGGIGDEIEIRWPDFNRSSPPATAKTARLELTGPVKLIVPHVVLKSAYGAPVGAYNGFYFSIPTYLPAGTYSARVTVDVPNTSLIHDYGSGNFPTAEGNVTFTANTVLNRGAGIFASGYHNYQHPGAGGLTVGEHSFYIGWPQLGQAAIGKVRFSMKNNATGVYYAIAPTTKEASANAGTWPGVPYFFGVDNIFEGYEGEAEIKVDNTDIAVGDYTLYLDEYSAPASARSYWTSTVPFTVPY